ncbi:DUF4913 domain-containing protein [Arthrobacter sp. PsM3]|uniref:DUF4913 domain-containing protein n=1 Tax=Arthrobacter sp. PsM3 TaxID=3030531 RepID=UPI0034608EF6
MQMPESLIRMGASWLVGEHLRLEPALGITPWWLSRADPHMRVLMDEEGPFEKWAYQTMQPRAASWTRSSPA